MNAASTRAKKNPTNCDERKHFFLDNIRRDIEAHESGRFDEIGAWTKTMPKWEECQDDEEDERLGIAYTFCDAWQHSRNHEWGYYRGVGEADWPIIARQIYQGLEENWPPDEMRNNFVFNPPPKPPKVPLWQRLKNRFRAQK